MPRPDMIRCENPTCSVTDFRRVAIGSYYTNLSQDIINDPNRFEYKGKIRAWDLGNSYSHGHFLCQKCKVALNICETCAHQTCVCKNESTD